MTALRHNGRLDRLDADRHPTLGAVLDACLGADDGEHVLLSVRLDGRAIDEAELAELRELPSDGVGELDVVSRPRRAVAGDALASAAAYAPAVSAALARAASLLRTGEVARGQALWADACAALDVLLHALAAVAASLPEADALPEAAASALREPLVAAAAAAERGDWLALADGLEHELAARVATLAARLRALLAPGAAAEA